MVIGFVMAMEDVGGVWRGCRCVVDVGKGYKCAIDI